MTRKPQDEPEGEANVGSFRSESLEVTTCSGGRELWRLTEQLGGAVERLLALGRAGVGGFVKGGCDEEGPWLIRDVGTVTLEEFWSGKTSFEYQTALRLISALAGCLETCERQGLWPGTLHPNNIGIRPTTLAVTLRADQLVRAELGLRSLPGRLDSASATRWTAPEQAAGAAWDEAANRYVLGLMLYRLLAGEHPGRGSGLRLGLQRLATRGPAPLSDEVAGALPPGLQSYCLRLLAPSATARPASAHAIVTSLAALQEGKSVQPEAARSSAPPQAAARRAAPELALPEPPEASGPPIVNWAFGLAWAAPLVLVVLGGWLWAAAEPPAELPAMRPRAALAAHELASKDCESCHPRQTAEWRRSIMSHSAKSPLFLALESLIQEQVGKSFECANGAGVMRKAGANACRDAETGRTLTGTAGEHWCVNCHAPGENLHAAMPAWDAHSPSSQSRSPLNGLLPRATMEGISCAFCHQVAGAAGPFSKERDAWVGNGSWLSPVTGARFLARPEDQVGRFGIANSGYRLDPNVLLIEESLATELLVPSGAHRRVPANVRAYLRSSEFCGACHDVRLFGTDVLGARQGEHFKRLRNAYSEWRDWAREQKLRKQPVYSCQDCHMSLFPGTCVPGTADTADSSGCPDGTVLRAQAPGSYPRGAVAVNGATQGLVRPHYFSGVDLPLSSDFPEHVERSVDAFGLPLGARARRDLLLSQSVQMRLGAPTISGRFLDIAVEFENVGAGHRVPAGFSQERELWVHLTVTDSRGRIVYEVGRVDGADEDLRDKRFLRINTDEKLLDTRGRPLGMFGADVADGPDVPRWLPDPVLGGTEFTGRGLVNFQNGFLRCVTCIGRIDSEGACQPLPGQETARADRYADGTYDLDTGRCSSNLSGEHALFETYFPVGSLDATRGILKAPDAIIDTRSLPPQVPIRYTYRVPLATPLPPYRVRARLLFRAFPPFLLRAFIAYERRLTDQGLRPNGPLIDERALRRLEVVELSTAERESR